MLLRLSKKENILVINKRNITKLANAVYPEYHWVIVEVNAFRGSTFFKQVYTSTLISTDLTLLFKVLL